MQEFKEYESKSRLQACAKPRKQRKTEIYIGMLATKRARKNNSHCNECMLTTKESLGNKTKVIKASKLKTKKRSKQRARIVAKTKVKSKQAKRLNAGK